MNYIKIVKLSTSYSIMAEGVGSVVESENGSFQSQITRRLPRKASRAAMSAWKPLCVKKSPGETRELGQQRNGPYTSSYSEPASLC